MEKLTWLLIIATIAALLFVCSLFLALYILLCEYYELKFHYLTPKKSGMVNKSSGYSSSTVTPSAVDSGNSGSRGDGGGGGGGGGIDGGVWRGRPVGGPR